MSLHEAEVRKGLRSVVEAVEASAASRLPSVRSLSKEANTAHLEELAAALDVLHVAVVMNKSQVLSSRKRGPDELHVLVITNGHCK